jgi:hypothetical protein
MTNLPPPPPKKIGKNIIIAIAVIAIVLIALVAGVMMGLSTNKSDISPTPTPSPTATPSPTPSATVTPMDFNVQVIYQSEQTNISIPNIQSSNPNTITFTNLPSPDDPNYPKGNIIDTTVQISNVQGFEDGSIYLTTDNFTQTTGLYGVAFAQQGGNFGVNTLNNVAFSTDMKIFIPNSTPSGTYSITVIAKLTPTYSNEITRSATYSFSIPSS